MVSRHIHSVVLSDLHFGEPNGLFADLAGNAGELRANDALDALVACLHDVARAAGGRPQLVLAGDIFELALAPEHVALELFDEFITRLFPEGSEGLFDPRLVFVPGNHDHALWTATREEVLARQLKTEPAAERIRPHPHSTQTFMARDTDEFTGPESVILTQMLRARHKSHPELRVVVGYPNVGVVHDGRAVLIDHGHFTDDIYRMMTTIARALNGGEQAPVELDQLEEDNSAWIDFLWSSLGREGGMATGLRRSYNLLHSDGGKMLLSTRLALVFGRSARTRIGRRIRETASRPILQRVLDYMQETDVRQRYVTKSEVDVGVGDYLDGPIARQMARELDGQYAEARSNLTFIYGHTHRPLAQRLPLLGAARSARIYNTGGWVVDVDEPRPATGGGIVLVDDSHDAVLIRVCSQAVAPHLAPVWVEHADGADASSPLLDSAREMVERKDGPWHEAAMTLSNAILRRRAERREQLVQEMRELSSMERMAVKMSHIMTIYGGRKRSLQGIHRMFKLERGRASLPA
jgi:UDP-2,3-diacylglucosamine pyrophosphatase LpxH